MVFEIRSVNHFKDKTFALSIYKGNAFYSIHQGILTKDKVSQRSHDRQVYELVQEQLQTIQN